MLSSLLRGLHPPIIYVSVATHLRKCDLEAIAAMFLFIYPLLSFSSYEQ